MAAGIPGQLNQPKGNQMNRAEKINVASLLVAVVTLILLLGYSIPRADATPQPAATAAAATTITAPPATITFDRAAVVTEAAPACEEDEPCWDCATMGNRICGPVTAPAAPAIQLPPCVNDEAEEGIAPCYWDAATRGNKQGHSFIWDGHAITYTS